MTSDTWPAFPAQSAPGQHPVETLTAKLQVANDLGGSVTEALVELSSRVERALDIRRTYLNDDEALEDIERALTGESPLHSLMVGDPR